MRRFVLLTLLLAAPLAAQQFTRTPGATEKYHNAAQAHIAGETDRAIQEAEAGLALDPDNDKLKRLLDLLRQQKPPQDGEDGQQDENSDSGDEGNQEQDDQSGENEQNGDGQQPPEEDDQTERDGTQQDQGEPDQQDDTNGSGQNQSPQQPQDRPSASGEQRGAQMSQAEAQRLLDAVGDEEELLVSKMRRPTRQRRSERDW